MSRFLICQKEKAYSVLMYNFPGIFFELLSYLCFACMYVCASCVCLVELEFQVGCEQLCRCWELNPDLGEISQCC